MIRLRALLGLTGVLAAGAAHADDAPAEGAPTKQAASAWCAHDLETLADDICFAPGKPAKDGRRTLVVFLHGLVDDGTTWQHQQQKGMAAFASKLGFSLIAPRGRNGVGPKRRSDQIGWPTAEEARKNVEDDLVAGWQRAQKTIEARDGKPFDEVFVMGFSNGAYYASSLALRGRLEVDGYAVFAGGSAYKGSERIARATKNRRPVFVGIASKDQTAKDGKSLAKLLKKLAWPHESSARRVGHVVSDAQLERAVAYLRKTADARKKKAPKPGR